MKLLCKLAVAAAMAASCAGAQAHDGWPARYDGVMLQGFYWDSYSDTKWTRLTAQADELSRYFSLIWVPNSGRSTSTSNQMGYMPVYWFTNHSSSFGTEAELLEMISTYKAKGTGFIADVVINHRVGRSNWTDFPSETWDGKTWHIGPEGICSTDEVRNASGQAKPTGAPDTGDDFDGARDLDHTNANVQDNCKNYQRCLLEKYGYEGVRLDMVKGYAGRFTKIYNEYSKPRFSVGEYWDGSYDAVAAWIEATGRTSAAFDFPGKYQINRAFANNDMTQLVWKAGGTTDQPAGLIHHGYQRYAVTFVDNHDTYRDGSKFTGDVPAANAFILCSPGTPCVFLPHWKQHKAAISQLINVRRAVGVHCESAVEVLSSSRDCYMARVKGTKGELVVRIGSSADTPAGYTDADVKARGTKYCVWTKAAVEGGEQGGGDDPVVEVPTSLYVLGNLSNAEWTPAAALPLTRSGDTYVAEGIEIVAPKTEPASTSGYFSFITARGTSWDAVNQHDRWGAAAKDAPVAVGTPVPVMQYPAGVNASSAYSWKAPLGKYTMTVDFKTRTLTLHDYAGIEGVEADADLAAPRYYTLQGAEVTDPAPGLYIVVRGTRVAKEIVR
ncbi:MAG: alpha-amylase family glycosyl hydrolase [Bacteroides sp.]|nr:alpha-amylase family glycosyl hydrolase [Bacteroides sp.]MCM1095607.1 alpha-amylase family glycosyl hydrolase [Terasakiella sp.]